MVKRAEVPQFGPLSGVKVLHNTISVAGPFAAELFAEMGADVIWIENPKVPCITRNKDGHTCEQERRNQRNIALDISTEQGKEVFLKLIEQVDVFISAARGGQYDRMGLSNEVLHKHNPKLVIAHISGFGQTGDPEYVKRSSFDPIAQAFGGYMKINGFPDKPSAPTFPYTADYMTALFTFSSAVAALFHAQKTGVGECIDIAQFEVMAKVQARHPMDYLMNGEQVGKEGAHSTSYAGYGTYKCKDDNEIYIMLFGGGILKKGLPCFGLDYNELPAGTSAILMSSAYAKTLEDAIEGFCATRTAEDVEKELLAASVPCSRILGYKEMLENSHYQQREVFVEWDRVNGKKIKGVGMIPRFEKSQAKIWRGAPTLGMDNEDILEEAGLNSHQISELYRAGVIGKK